MAAGNKTSFKRRAAVLLFWILLWQAVSMAVNNAIILAGPVEVLQDLLQSSRTVLFWKTAAFSLGRVVTGFMAALAAAVPLAALSFALPAAQELLAPVLGLMKSVPAASFTVLVLVWTGSGGLSIIITFLMVFPIIYFSALEGLKSVDPALSEMMRIFRVSWRNRVFFLYRPALMPHLNAAMKTALGLSFKAGIAAEVIGTPRYSIGERIYLSKISLNTAGLFSWTAVLIALSVLFEKAFRSLFLRMGRLRVRVCFQHPCTAERAGKKLEARGLIKRYAGETLLGGFSCSFQPGGIYGLMGKSGSGKSTLFRILLGLAGPDGGSVNADKGIRYAVVFQEDRLCMDEDAVTNVRMALCSEWTEEKAKEALLELLPEECLDKPVRQLSGGMKRRVAVARAVLADSHWLVMDEPFTGMDKDTRKKTIDFILKRRGDRTVLFSTHQAEEIGLMGAEGISL